MSGPAAVIVFLREPMPGKVKTRLAASIGAEAAAAVYRRLIDITLDAVASARLPTYLFYDGPLPGLSDRVPGFTYAPQSTGDLGARMLNALARVQAIHGHTILIGSDCPEISAAVLHEAFGQLRTQDVVIGPAADGGYYLIGIAGPPDPRLFNGIPWSTDRVFALTLDRCADAGLKVSVMPMRADVDTLEDLHHFPALLPDTAG